jgi:signal transduction histidine kinase
MDGTSAAAGISTSWRPRPVSVAIVVAAVVLAAVMFSLSRSVTQRDNHSLLVSQAGVSKTAVAALIGQLESTISSVGSVAAATGGNPGAVNRLAAADPAVDIFSALVILHRSPSGSVAMVAERGTPSAPPLTLGGAKGQALADALDHGGVDIIGFFGRGAARRLAMVAGAPTVPGGYVVYAEVPLPAGTTFSSGFSGLRYAVYDGRTQSAPLLFATAGSMRATGQVRQLIDLDDIYGSGAPKRGDSVLLFLVSSSGTVGTLSDALPWILGALALLGGLLVAFVVEATARRKDQAVALVADLEQKNAELDLAMTEQARAEEHRVRLEGELRQSQRLEAVGRLAGGVAHDFNNLLAVILTYGDFMAEELEEDHPLQGDLGEVRKAATRAAELTRKLLVFSRRDLVSPTVLDVNETITDLLSLLHRTLGEEVELRTELASDLPCVLADPGEVEQVLVNLVVNARDAMVGEGTITVETSEQILDEEAASAHVDLSPGRYVRINVTDNGCGMTPEVASRVFEPFFTTKGPGTGTGLGLSTVYGIVNRYAGHVTMYSEEGVGSTFKVYLPATEDRPDAQEETPTSTSESSATGETVLVVEDEDAVRNACRRILEGAGFRVLEASSGPEVLANLADDRVDLLLTDVIMPGGLSGRELADRLVTDRPDLRVLYMSGYNADAIATRGVLDAGVTVVEKPFTSSDLLGKVRELLASP